MVHSKPFILYLIQVVHVIIVKIEPLKAGHDVTNLKFII